MKSGPLVALSDSIRLRQESLTPRIQQLPHTGSRPLTIAGRVAGWATPRATECLAQLPFARVTDEAVHVADAPRRTPALAITLACIAQSLPAHRCLRGWREALLGGLGDGPGTCALPRAATRAWGLLAQAVHLK